MDYKKILNEHFGDLILDAKMVFDPESSLEITINTDSLDVVTEQSRKIVDFLESQTWFKDSWNVIVLSKGTDLNVNLDNVTNYIGQMVTFNLHKSFEGQNVFNVEILEDLGDEILVRWNNKGNFRKIKLNKSNITKAEKYIKF
ncbi:ribosome assembly cofactor RimP [Mycoplasmopsis gallinacea]|uniref:Ribosome assembly cofactor RimP n=1 Tax=Mycoplasmopsis gallinacea TaxID=29556 RepID=A0A6H0V2E0_9BACT|nr:ribosome assembly cofactor RimP [Mycoplasmopsis gallinacea]QIW61894.1 ribosome assembly cofactor RimP [Mycoplasmopsis gallinacea]